MLGITTQSPDARMASKRKPSIPQFVDGKHCSDSTFQALLTSPEDYFLLEVFDDRYKPLGTACARVTERYEADREGAFVKLQYVATASGI